MKTAATTSKSGDTGRECQFRKSMDDLCQSVSGLQPANTRAVRFREPIEHNVHIGETRDAITSDRAASKFRFSDGFFVSKTA